MKYDNRRIVIVDNSNLSYSGEDIDGKEVRGTEASLILLAEQFYRMGINVDYCNCIDTEKIVNGVIYFNKNKINKKINYDLAIVISDANMFSLVTAKKSCIF